MAKTFDREAAEREANEIAFQFRNSHDVVGDMSRAYHTDFSGIRMHEDAAAQARVNAAGTDALAKGSDLYFKKGILDGNDQASRGLLAHELAHTMQQGIVGGEVSESAPAGAEQGGFLDWIKGVFGGKRRKKKELQMEREREQHREDMQKFEGQRAQAMTAVEAPKMPPFLMNPFSSPLMNLSDLQKNLSNANTKAGNESWVNPNGQSGVARVQRVFNTLANNDGRTRMMAKNVHESIFNGSFEQYQNYMEALDTSGADRSVLSKNIQTQHVGGKDYKFNDYSIGITNDMYDMIGNYLNSEFGLDYASTLFNGVKKADIFQPENQSGVTPMNFLMHTVLDNESGKVASSTRLKKYENAGGNIIGRAIQDTMRIGPMFDAMSEEERQQLPENLKSLYTKYKEVEQRLAEALVKNRGITA